MWTCCGVVTFCSESDATRRLLSQVKPLRKQLKVYKAWITGQRKDQSPGTRTEVPVVQVREAMGADLLKLLSWLGGRVG